MTAECQVTQARHALAGEGGYMVPTTVSDLSPDRIIALAARLRQQADELEILALQLSPSEAESAANGRGAH